MQNDALLRTSPSVRDITVTDLDYKKIEQGNNQDLLSIQVKLRVVVIYTTTLHNTKPSGDICYHPQSITNSAVRLRFVRSILLKPSTIWSLELMDRILSCLAVTCSSCYKQNDSLFNIFSPRLEHWISSPSMFLLCCRTRDKPP